MEMDYEIKEKRLLTKDERESKKTKARWDAEQNLALRKKSDDAFRTNYERLKSERLARENNS